VADADELVRSILEGPDPPQGDTLEAFVEHIAGPYREAIGDLSARSPQERLRLQHAVRELGAELRLRTLMAELPSADRRLAEAFARRYPQTARHLFHDDPYEQQAALRSLPLQRGTGASLLVGMLVFDPDERVGGEAARVAVRLGDELVARELCRTLRDLITLLREGYFGPGSEDVELVVGRSAYRVISVISRVPSADCMPEVLEVATHFADRFDPRLLDVTEMFAALGRIRDERAVPLLHKYVNVRTILNARRTPDNVLVVQSVGDAALHALLTIYGLDPRAFGFVQSPGAFGIPGFTKDAIRREAHARFERWYERNAHLPPDRREPVTSAPATQPDE